MLIRNLTRLVTALPPGFYGLIHPSLKAVLPNVAVAAASTASTSIGSTIQLSRDGKFTTTHARGQISAFGKKDGNIGSRNTNQSSRANTRTLGQFGLRLLQGYHRPALRWFNATRGKRS